MLRRDAISSLVILILFFRNAFVPFVSRLIEMNLDPLALIVLLDLDLPLFQPLQVLKLSDPLFERRFATIVEDTGDDGLEDAKEFVPGDDHDDEHDQVE